MQLWGTVASAISDATHRPFVVRDTRRIHGGDINEAYRLDGNDGSRYFVKLNATQHHKMFTAEMAGLDAIGATGTLRVPRPIAQGMAGRHNFLVLEYLEFGAGGDAQALGTQLAAMHRCSARQFGFSRDNFIGATPQPNPLMADWISFWREHRLGFQLRLAAENGYGGKLQTLGEQLSDALPAFFEGYSPVPSVLHGDLWSGNHAFLSDGTPAIFDPAAYYGDRECDIAMTELFGGYPPAFYAAYRAAWPLDAGYPDRRSLYNLYHILNHANLFGGGYAVQAECSMQRLLAELG